jgi:diaminopropionate ammonia-lyase
MLTPRPFRVFANPRHGVPGMVVLPTSGFRRARTEISGWDGYAPTPLRDLPVWAASASVASIQLKDEASRFGLGSFKALGGAYAVANLLRDALSRSGVAPSATSAELGGGRYRIATQAITVACATDGNHGRSVAWGASRFGCRCVIFVHETVSQKRVDAIAAFGAEIHRVQGTYDDAVRAAARQAAAGGWLVASDTSWPGYTEVPRDIMQGYRIMADEAADQWVGPPPTHVFVQGGVGGAAAAVSAHTRLRFNPVPKLVVVEPERAACLLASAERGALTAIAGDLNTVMAGLACGEPSLLAWEELSRSAMAFLAIPDESAIEAVQRLSEENIVAGESGVAGLAGMILSAKDSQSRFILRLTPESRVLLFNTEGATGD